MKHWDINFHKLTYGHLVEFYKTDGVVLRQTAFMTNYNGSNSAPETTYIWFDKVGNSVTAKFPNAKFFRTQKGDSRVGSGKNSKLSAVDLYNKVVKIPYQTTLDNLINKLGEPTKVMYENINPKTGAIAFGTYLWSVEDVKDG